MTKTIDLGKVSRVTRELYPVAMIFEGGKAVCPSNPSLFNRLGNSGPQRPDACFTT